MSDLSFEQMLEESFKTIHNGEVVEGTVIDVKEDEIILNIGYKADGIITRSEYTNDAECRPSRTRSSGRYYGSQGYEGERRRRTGTAYL